LVIAELLEQVSNDNIEDKRQPRLKRKTGRGRRSEEYI
jgi:hypothetical protein